jgi:PAS domain-containing protein
MDMRHWTIDGIGLFDINFDTGERYWSCEMRQILGIPRDAPADFHLLLQHVHPEDRRAFGVIAMEPFRPYCPKHKTSEFRIVQADGSVHWVHLERVAIFRANAAHDVVRVLGFVIEISEPTEHQRAWQWVDIAA